METSKFSRREFLQINMKIAAGITAGSLAVRSSDVFSAEESPVVKMANMVLTKGILEDASDIHINPEEKMVRVRYRVDGVLRDALNLPKNLQEALTSRIKILSNMDIAENRIPQDGQIRLKIKKKVVEIRVSTLPSANGENVVMRILDKRAALLRLENLGFEDDVLGTVKKILHSA